MWISVQEPVAGSKGNTHVLNHSFLLLCHMECMWYKKIQHKLLSQLLATYILAKDER